MASGARHPRRNLGMASMTNRLVAAVGLIGLTISGVPTAGDAATATLYELTENMRLDALATPSLRTASAALQGTAATGTPICPAALVQLLGSLGLPTGSTCTITAFAEDAITLSTGSGTFDGSFAVVVNADNPVDGPELVVMTGSFGAGMQILVDANGNPLPLIQITDGTVTPTDVLGVPVPFVGLYFTGFTAEMFSPAPFTGLFRLPFAMHDDRKVRPQRNADAFYLGDDGELIKLQRNEMSLGYATVRVEIAF
jgi:hypothetical protein